MSTITFTDPEVRAYIDAHFIPVYIDQDSRPDISQRYERWGWPATILFGADGTEIVKLKGYYSPKFFLPILQGTVADPSPIDYGQLGGDGRPASRTLRLDEAQRKLIIDFMHKAWDEQHGGWGLRTKFVDEPTLVYALEQAHFDSRMEDRARATLLRLIDMISPEHGGLSQISLKLDWSEPLEEYPMFAQQAGLTAFSLAYARWVDDRFLEAARQIHNFLTKKMRDADGGFHTSYGAHNFEPGVDRSRYARENGQAITALIHYYDATGKDDVLQLAIDSANWVIANRQLPQGGFRHDTKDPAGPYLGDTLHMANAMLHLYRSTGDRSWLSRVLDAADFMQRNFFNEGSGAFISSARPTMAFMAEPVLHKDDNVLAARLYNLLWHYTGEQRYRDTAELVMGYLTSDRVLDAYYFLPGVLQAEFELANEPVHVTVVGHRDDKDARALYRAALAYPTTYKRTEWWDRREGDLPRNDIVYPQMEQAAAFACSGTLCSTPVTDPLNLAAAVDRLRSGN
jgi:uncharacterized protein YyaL (SSP411 family)